MSRRIVLQRGFFVYQGAVAIKDLTIQNAAAQGGTGGRAGVGGDLCTGWASPPEGGCLSPQPYA